MANITIPIPTFYAGVSRQAPTVRFPSQVEEADNVLLSVEKGASKRPGSEMQFAVASLTAAGAYRIHTIERDELEKYLLLYGASTIRVFDLDGNEYFVLISSEAQAYLDANSATAADLRCVTVADYTLLLNRTVKAGALTSDPFTVTAEHKDYAAMIAQMPAHDTFHRAKEDDSVYDSARIAGYWKYAPGPGTFAKIVFNPVTGVPGTPAEYKADAKNPGGFKIPFVRLPMALAAAAWDQVEYTLTKAGAFANYTWREGDQIRLTGGTGVAAGWYVIRSRVSDNAIVLATSCAAAANADTTSDYIGLHCIVTSQFAQETFADMHAVALAFQSEMRKTLGAEDALIGWTDTGLLKGYMTITSPFRGENATILKTESPAAGYDYTATTLAFSNIGAEYAITAGTGTPDQDTLSPFDRWTRQPAPNQPKALLDPDKLPIQIVRKPVSDLDYVDVVKEDIPFAYWRLGEAAGVTAADEMGANDGTYVAAPSLGVAGAISGDTDTAVTFDGYTSADQCVDIGTLGNLASQMAIDGLTVECWFKCTEVFGTNQIFNVRTTAGNLVSVYIYVNRLRFTIYDNSAVDYFTASTALDAIAYDDGEWHHLVVIWTPGVVPNSDAVKMYYDGAAVDFTITGEAGIVDTFTNFATGGWLAATTGTTYWFDGTLDEVAVYSRVLTPRQIRDHYEVGRATFAAFFDVDTIAWTPRYTGDQFTNPLPSIIKDERTLSDIGFHANRTVLAGDENIVYSQSGDFFNFFIENHDDIGDADPIDSVLSSSRITIVDHVVAFDKVLVIFTKAGQQFETNAPLLFTYETVAVTPSTAYKTIEGVRPVPMENYLYFPAIQKGTCQLLEYYYSEDESAHKAADVSKHCAGYLPGDIQTLEVGLNNNVVLLIAADGYTIYAYRYYWDAEKKVQSAWAKYTFNTTERIADIGVIGNDIWVLVEDVNNDYYMTKLSIPHDAVPSGWEYLVHLDNRVNLTGVHAAGTTTWTLAVPDENLDVAVLGPVFGVDSGNVVTLTKVNSTHYTASGNYSAGVAALGRKYIMNLTLSRPYVRSNDGAAILDMTLQLLKLVTNHTNTGQYTIRVAQAGRANRDYAFTPRDGSLLDEEGNNQAFLMGRADDTQVSIRDDSPFPVTISSAEYAATFTQRSR